VVKGTFGERIDELKRQVGKGHLKGEVEVNQAYAHYQHDHPEFHHPDGGKAFYLRDPLFAGANGYMRNLADKVITEAGSDIETAMAENMESLSTEGVYAEAPWEFGDLRASGHPMVTSDGEKIYDRAPQVARLTEDELRAKGHLRALFDPDRYKR
jgi:hypothetical protein